jgi:ATP-dependent helicase/nuclease subunit A
VNNGADHSDETRDQESRQRICEQLDRNFMVEAAAGTGKTTSIVNRMVNLVSSGTCDIQHLVAVTFTRKAAAELRERFQAELRRRAAELQQGNSPEEQATYLRLQSATDFVSRAFVGTIHSFCAAVLRERPIEFGVDPNFRELDEDEDQQLREQSWHENINDLFASSDPLIDQIDDLGLDRRDLKSCFNRFIGYRDVEQWPCTTPHEIDVAEIQQQTRAYINDMNLLLPLFPNERGNDKLMARYEEIVRGSGRDWNRLGNFFRLLEKFDTSHGAVQKQWHDSKTAKQEKNRWEEFRQEMVRPAMDWWCRKRYRFVVEFVRRAVEVYERQKSASGGLDFTDLLLTAASGLKSQPGLRKYFQGRFTHFLVDEFQDTDPIQAEMILCLTSENVAERDWHHCKPRPGSLFLVGDPKQSIYRFRRGDIVTYNRVKEIFEQSGGEVLSLIKNFRSRDTILSWNNRVYSDKFLAQANQYITAAENMVRGRVDAQDGTLSGVHKLTLQVDAKIEETTKREADSIARYIRAAIDAGMTVPRTSREIELGRGTAVQPRDFLIIPRGKKRIGYFKEAIDRYGIPCEVTGGNAFLGIDQLTVLIACLRAVDDPHHGIHYLAILRDSLFAFSDAELYEFKRTGGRFSFTAKLPDDLEPQLRKRFDDVNSRLRRYQIWLRTFPFSAAVSRIASDLGLLASAAAASEGNIALGGFLKAAEALRQNSCSFDSASDVIDCLQQLEELDETEGCTALPPNPNVVRVMNLHKAKGLEAPVVFLTDTAGPFKGAPICHIDRSGDTSTGYMGITAKKGKWGTKEVATPEHWKQFQEEEQRFLDAEADRLLYVATTRAACMLVVSVGKDNSSWTGLHSYLEDAPELVKTIFPPGGPMTAEPTALAAGVERDANQSLRPEASAYGSGKKAFSSAVQGEGSADAIRLTWATAREPSYVIESAKEAALKGTSRPRWQARGDYGHKWGSAVHELLEVALKAPAADLQASAHLFSDQYDLGAERVSELLTTVRSVMQSEIWTRAQKANRCFSELPFETLSHSDDSRPVITRGVIDLLFEEADGWVVVDYKTDDITVADVPSAVDYYRPQLAHYAQHWCDTTNDGVSEQGIYFTRINLYVPCTSSSRSI